MIHNPAEIMSDARQSELYDLLVKANQKTVAGPDGVHRPTFGPNDLIGVVMHRDDPVCQPELREQLVGTNEEYAVFIAVRDQFVEGVSLIQDAQTGQFPYAEAVGTMRAPAPLGHVYFAMFSARQCTIAAVAFDHFRQVPA